MLYNICGLFVVSFAIVGIIDLYKTLSLTLYAPKINNSLIIIPIGSDSNKTEFLIRGAIAKIRWFNISRHQQIVCLDCGMTDESRTICQKLCEQYPFISIKNTEELKNYLNNTINEKNS